METNIKFINDFDEKEKDIKKELKEWIKTHASKLSLEEQKKYFDMYLETIKKDYLLTQSIQQLITYYKPNIIKIDNSELYGHIYYIEYPDEHNNDPFNIKIIDFSLMKLFDNIYLPIELIEYCGMVAKKEIKNPLNHISKAINKESQELIDALKDNLGFEYSVKKEPNNNFIYHNINSPYGNLLYLQGTKEYAIISFVKIQNDLTVYTSMFVAEQGKNIIYVRSFTLTPDVVDNIGKYYNEKEKILKQKQEEKQKEFKITSIENQIVQKQKELSELRKRLKKENAKKTN